MQPPNTPIKITKTVELIALIETVLDARIISKRSFLTRVGYAINSFAAWRTGEKAPKVTTALDMLDALEFDLYVIERQK